MMMWYNWRCNIFVVHSFKVNPGQEEFVQLLVASSGVNAA